MCGIAGIYNFSGQPVERDRLERMAEAMRHRGPDDDGFLADGPFGMSMRRLSIIDLDTGSQPISSEDGSVTVIFNGEIYNHLELRAALESRGHRFITKCDTEVIVHLYEERGPALAQELIGMFAIAVWDAPRRKLTLIRDRLGVKPLYWSRCGNEFLFGSEIKCLLAAAAIPRDIDSAALDAYMQCQYFPFDSTILSAVRKLRAGHFMTIEKGATKIERYWELKFSDCHADVDEREAVARFREMFYKSVERRLMSDVPLGAFLSGGIDSAAVLAAMSELTSAPVKTFTLGFGAEAPGYSELEPARASARAFGAERHERVASPDEIAERLDAALDHFDEPFGGGIHTWLVAEFAAPHVKVALTGIGADELLGGYERQKKSRLVRAYKKLPLAARRAAIATADTLRFGDKARKLDRIASVPARDAYYEWIAVAHPNLKRTFYNPAFLAKTEIRSIGQWAADTFGSDMPSDPDDLISYLELKTTLADDFLNYTDRMTMAWGLEARVPFLDHQLVEYTASLPMNLKLKGGVTKYILKRAMKGTLPQEIINRRKQPFHLPIGIWFKKELRPLLEKTLCADELACAEYFNPEAVRGLVKEHINGDADRAWLLWSLLLVERWMKKNT